MNLPNFLSIFRLFLTIFFVIAVQHQNFGIALIIFIVQGVSDLLDGFLARVMGTKTHIGSFLDPLADKVMLVTSYIVLSVYGVIPFWVTSIVISRDIFIIVGFFILYRLSTKTKPLPTIISKMTTLSQIITIVYVLWSQNREFASYLFYVTAILSVVSGCVYGTRGVEVLMKKENI